MTVSRRVVLHFSKDIVDKSIVCYLARELGLEFNILKAYVTPEEGGVLVMELSGERKDYEKGVRYLTRTGVKIQPLTQNVIRDEEKCTHCGACIAICPVEAFTVDPVTRRINFAGEKCNTCGLCIRACPAGAMEVKF